MTIDKSPRPLLTLSVTDLVQALNIIATSNYRMQVEYNPYPYKHVILDFKVQKGEVFLGSHIITALEVDFKTEAVKSSNSFCFLNPEGEINYSDFYARNKYDLKRLGAENAEFETKLASWQEKHSKNHKKDMHKVVSQFRRTKSVQSAIKVLEMLPELKFNDTRRYERGYVFSRDQMKISLQEETRLQQLKDISNAESKVKHLEAELIREGERLLKLKEQLKQSKQA